MKILMSFFPLIIVLVACSIQKDGYNKSRIKLLKTKISNTEYSTHFKMKNHILSIHDSIGNQLKSRFPDIPDSIYLKRDTIDVSHVDQYFIAQNIKYELRKCMERKEIKIYSISQSEYMCEIKRTVSNLELNSFLTTNIQIR